MGINPNNMHGKNALVKITLSRSVLIRTLHNFRVESSLSNASDPNSRAHNNVYLEFTESMSQNAVEELTSSKNDMIISYYDTIEDADVILQLEGHQVESYSWDSHTSGTIVLSMNGIADDIDVDVTPRQKSKPKPKPKKNTKPRAPKNPPLPDNVILNNFSPPESIENGL